MPKIIVKDHKYYFKIRGLGGIKGDTGPAGPQGPQGPQGPYVNVVAGTTTTLPAGSSAQVTVNNTGNTSVLNFGVPQGTKGDKGDAGTPGAQGPRGFAATVNVGETTTGQPGTNASVINAGNENDAVLKFTIPRGEKGETGETGPQGPTGGVKSTVVAELPETGESDKYYLVYRDSEGGTIATTDGYAQIENGENGGDLTASQLLGNAEQTTYSGKNLWNGAEPLAVTGYGTYALAKPLPAGTYTLSASSITTTGTGTYSLVMFLDSANQTVASDYVVFSTKQRSFTLTSEATQVRIYSQDGYQQSQGVTTTFTGIQIESGSTATSYEPYVGGTPAPNPDYPQPISVVTGEQTVTVTGKNLYNNDLPLDNKYLDASGNWATSLYAYINQEFIVQPSTAYTWSVVSKTGAPSLRLGEFDASGTFIRRTLITADNQTVTTTATTALVKLSADETAQNKFDQVQLELGSTATAYEPYQGQSYAIDLGSIELAKVGNYQDRIYKSNSKWYIEKQVGKTVITSDNASEWSLNSTSYAAPAGYCSKANLGWKTGWNTGVAITNRYSEITSIPQIASGKFGTNFQQPNFLIFDSSFTDLNTMWTNLVGTEIYIALATPTTTEITDETLLSQLNFLASLYEGENNISLVGAGAQGELTGNYVVYDKYNRHKVYIWSSDDNTWQIILQ